MTITQPFLIPANEQRRDPWRVLAGGERTGGLVTIGVEIGSQRYQAGPGSLIWLPRGIPHTFANLTSEAVCTVGVITPSGLENMFAEIAAYLAALTGPPDPQTITAINAKYGVSPADGPPFL
jgi:hypothetical protein